MPLVLNARNNPNYGGNLINQKYSPLENIDLGVGVRAEYEALFDDRRQVLRNSNAYPPNALSLYANWPLVVNPAVVPTVTISSNRANWMRTVLQNAADHVANTGAFTGYLDATTFDYGPVPWYAPLRSTVPAYIVVHWSEYDYYNDRLNGFANVTVVGYKFDAVRPALDLVGFGASRYAAMQLMIQLGYHRAWAVDDNTVNVNGFPNLLTGIEANMPVGSAIWGISFNGATANINLAGLYDGRTTFAAVPYIFGNMLAGLLQQVVLWNIDQFRGANLNFCPLFIASNEDSSLSNFLQHSGHTERIISACRTVKIEPDSDPATNNGAYTLIPARRNRAVQLFANIQPAIQIDPGVGGARDLRTYITATVLPTANQPLSTAGVAESRAIEQAMAEAALIGWYPATAFNPYNGAPVVVQQQPANL